MTADTIGCRLRAERNRLGVTQTTLAKLVGAKKGTQISWEQDRSAPTATALAIWADAGLDVLFVITGERRPTPPAVAPAGIEGAARAILATIPAAERLSLLLDLVAEARRG